MAGKTNDLSKFILCSSEHELGVGGRWWKRGGEVFLFPSLERVLDVAEKAWYREKMSLRYFPSCSCSFAWYPQLIVHLQDRWKYLCDNSLFFKCFSLSKKYLIFIWYEEDAE